MPINVMAVMLGTDKTQGFRVELQVSGGGVPGKGQDRNKTGTSQGQDKEKTGTG